MKVYSIINTFNISGSEYTDCYIENYNNRESAIEAFREMLKKLQGIHDDGRVYLESKHYYTTSDKIGSVEELFDILLSTGGCRKCYTEDDDFIFVRCEEVK